MPTPPKQGMGTGAKIGIGCGIAVLVLILLCGVGGFVGWQVIEGKVKAWEGEFAAKGLTLSETAQAITVTVPPTKPTYYKGQIVTLNFSEPVTVEIGVIAQVTEVVQGQFKENVYFRGQVINANPSVKFEKELNVECQVVQDRGATMVGGLTGTYSARQ